MTIASITRNQPDQANGGVLKIASTRPERVAAVLRRLPDRASMQVVEAKWSFEQLRDTEQRLESRLNADPTLRTAELAIDVRSNRVGVFQRAVSSSTAGTASAPTASICTTPAAAGITS
jgi:hypothetical protein